MDEDRKPRTSEGVRIIGARETGATTAAGDWSDATPPSEHIEVGETSEQPGPTAEAGPDWDGADGGWMNDDEPGAPDPVAALPHWTEPPEPRAEGGDDSSSWEGFTGQGPRWRDANSDWGDVHGSDPAMLSDASIRVGALDPERKGAADQLQFDDADLVDPRRAGASGGEVGGEPAQNDGGPTTDQQNVMAHVEPGRRSRARRTVEAGTDGDGHAVSASARGPQRSSRPPVEAAPPTSGRDMGAAIGTGVAVAAGALLVFYVGKSAGAAALVVAVLALAVMEFYTALRQRAFHPAIPVGLVATVALASTAYWKGAGGILVTCVLTVLVSFLWYLFRVEPDRPAVNIAVTLLGVMYIGLLGSMANLILTMPNGTGRGVVMGGIAGTVGYDVAGFLLGRRFGKVPLAPEVSPNKTVEGLIAGMVGAFLTCVVVFGVIGVAPWNLNKSIALGIVVAIAAPLGDLAESMLKRDLGLKDMGALLPGHGGVLDRIDAMLFVLPAVFFLALRLHFL